MKVRDLLAQQLETEFSEDAKECIAVYDKLVEIEGRVWQSKWLCLTNVVIVNKKAYYRLSKIGKYFLKGIEK